VSDVVRLEVADGIGTIRLNRPPVNALDAELQRALIPVCAEATQRSDVAAVIVYGGERAFAAGADIKEMEAMSYTDMVAHSTLLQDFTRALARIPKPTVAAVTGYALGGGCEVALACDFRVVAENAKLGQPEILLGIIPGGGGTQRLARLVGPARAKDLVLSGRQVRAEEALAIGLVDEVVPADELLERVRERAAGYATGALAAQALAKRAVDEGLDLTLDEGLELEQDLFEEVFATDDAGIGVRSFRENGPGRATFTGR
jgi:enoyl-CoA hydratase/carnithine racemase